MVNNESRGHESAPGSAPQPLLHKNAKMKQRQLAERELEESARAACQSLALQSFKKIKQN